MKTVKINYNGQDAEVTIKKWTLRERNDCYRIATKYNNLGQPQLDLYTLEEQVLAKCIVTAPFQLGVDNLQNLDPNIADQLFKEIQEYNTITDIKK